MTLAELLEAENDPEVPAFVCPATGIPAWTQIRGVFTRMAISDWLYATVLEGAPRYSPGFGAVLTLARSALHNQRMLRGISAAPVCLFTDSIANHSIDGRWFNRLTDPFALAEPARSLTVEDQFEWRWPFPRVNERVLLHAPLQARIALVARWRQRAAHARRAGELVELVCSRAQRLTGWRPGPARELRLRQMLARKLAALPVQLAVYEKLLKRLHPRLILVLAGVYGPAAALMVAARRHGTVTAEFQHGVVAAGHDAYNFAPAVRDDAAYRQTMPEHFLSYGDWWNGQINAPMKTTTIGNPYRDAKLGQLQPGPARDVVLVLSDGTEFELYLRFAQEVAAGVGSSLRVVLRTHPVERSQVQAKYGNAAGAVEIDQSGDLYASLTRAHAVVTELSTALFEAVGIAERVFMWSTAKSRFMFPSLPFQLVDSAASMVEQLGTDSSGRISNSLAESIWARDWQRRYRDFLDAHGVAQ